jgi:hypothetical protein
MALISRALFRYTVQNPGDAAEMHEFRRGWNASTVTYNNLPMPQMTLPFPPALIDTYWGPTVNDVYTPLLGATLTVDVTPSVNRWLTGTPNHGWIFVRSSSRTLATAAAFTPQTGLRWRSSRCSRCTSTRRPRRRRRPPRLVPPITPRRHCPLRQFPSGCSSSTARRRPPPAGASQPC